MEAANAAEYEKLADSFLSAAIDRDTHCGTDRHGDTLRYNASTGEFAILTGDNVIRSYHHLRARRGKTGLQRFLEKARR
jgi:hypothetical protein